MNLITKPQSVFLLMLLLISVEGDADTDTPATRVFDEPSKDNVQKKNLHEAVKKDVDEPQAQQQKEQVNQIHTLFENDEQKQAAQLQEDFRVGNIGSQEQAENHQQHRDDQLQPDSRLDVHHQTYSEPPLGQTDQDKTRIPNEPSSTDSLPEKSAHQLAADDISKEAVTDNVVDNEDEVDLQAPPEHIPLSKTLLNQEQEQQQPQDQQQPQPGASFADIDSPVVEEHSAIVDGDVGSFDSEKGEARQTLSEEELEGERLFHAGERLINATYYKEYKEAYLTFLRAAQLNHKKAQEYVAFGSLFGDYLPQNVTRATELFTELADLGSPKAQMGLAFMYSAGLPYNSSQAKALIYLTFGALGGDPLAQMALGYRYYAGVGVESKCETALTYYRKVATKVADSVTLAGGPVVQRIRLQEETESQGTNNGPLLDDDLLQYYHFLADKGDQQAQVVLGTLYYQGGKGVQINHEQAYHYFSTAADSGSGHALGYLGKMHSEGSPVVIQSNHTAFEYFKKSADKNNHIGQTGLGMMYLNGLGVEKDTSKAFRYFSLASDQGSVDAQLQLGIMYFTGNGVRKDYKMAVKYFTMSSQNGHVLAFYNLAQMHATGTGVLRNCHTAVELFKNVAERGRWSEMLMDAHRMYHEGSVDTALVKYMFLAELGYEVAQSNVAYMLDSGVSSKFGNYETHQRALLQYSRAASQGSTHARLKMGDYHYYGLGTDIDYESAATHYRMASEQQHNAQAMFNLGYMHEKGLGLKQDVHLAKRFYDMAAETSLDAHVPVTLALFKLGIFYGVDVFNKEFEGVSGIIGMLDPESYLGPEWDLYLASVLAILFGILFFLRRMR